MRKFERIILSSKPVTHVRERSKKIFIRGFHGLPLYEVFKFFLTQIQREGLNIRAAAISFNIVMAIPAASIFLFTLIPYLPVAKNIHAELLRVIVDITPDANTRKLVTTFLDDFFNKPKTGLLSIGFVLAMFYASNAMMGIIRSFDRSLVVRVRTNFISKRIRAIKLTIIMVLLIIGTALISVGQGVLFNKIMEWLHVKNPVVKHLIQDLRWIIVVLLFLSSIAFVYKFAPSIHKRWKLLSPGAVFATILMILATYLFSVWVQNFSNYNKFYGSIGTVLMMMLLIYMNSLVLLIGYELNISISYLKHEAEKRLLEEQMKGG
ncbi:MAG TPA: YihY/virulence factor BrkB family protein [Chitinophagaceae bacterium]|nr:YihY/virulence factor BrkB family protein [Chitinophagaceae bacterium]